MKFLKSHKFMFTIFTAFALFFFTVLPVSAKEVSIPPFSDYDSTKYPYFMTYYYTDVDYGHIHVRYIVSSQPIEISKVSDIESGNSIYVYSAGELMMDSSSYDGINGHWDVLPDGFTSIKSGKLINYVDGGQIQDNGTYSGGINSANHDIKLHGSDTIAFQKPLLTNRDLAGVVAGVQSTSLTVVPVGILLIICLISSILLVRFFHRYSAS